jgi:hypothetical protein
MSLGRILAGAAVGAYSARNESGWGFAGGIAGGVLGGKFLGRFAPRKLGSWGMGQMAKNKGFASGWAGNTGLGGFAKNMLTNGLGAKGKLRVGSPAFKTATRRMRSLNKAFNYAGVGIAAGMGASLGSSTLRSNRGY